MSVDVSVSRELQEMVDGEMGVDERVEWMSMEGFSFLAINSVAAIFFGLLVIAFAVGWVGYVCDWRWPESSSDYVQPFLILCSPFGFMGPILLFSPWWSRWKASKTVYVVTNRRAIIFRGGFSTTVHSYFPEHLHKVTRFANRDGSGDVILYHPTLENIKANRRGEYTFRRIQNAEKVEQLLKDLAAKCPSPPEPPLAYTLPK